MSDTPSDAADHSESNSPRASGLATCILGGLCAYVGVFVILYLDAIVLRTHFVDRWISPAFHVPLRIFFYPLLLIWLWLGWAPGPVPSIR
ncbi:MAG: hypothetical protein IAG10_33980 [Planctomycetaceae bacterium]|nr:hypothetical protein [Planctomycetaceae bacterium]